MQQIVKKPLISEKSFARTAQGKFTFLADPDADKILLKEIIEELYKVNVEKVNTASVKGKIKKTRGRGGKRDDYKKFIVTLKKGQNIALFDVETEEKKEAEKADKKTDKKINSPKDTAKEDKKAKTELAGKEQDGVTTTIKKSK